MNLFYNKEKVGDVAFLQIDPQEGPFNYETKRDIVQITANNEVVGYNIFNASTIVHIEGNGHVKLTDEIINKFNQAISNAGFTHELVADLSPKFVVRPSRHTSAGDPRSSVAFLHCPRISLQGSRATRRCVIPHLCDRNSRPNA